MDADKKDNNNNKHERASVNMTLYRTLAQAEQLRTKEQLESIKPSAFGKGSASNHTEPCKDESLALGAHSPKLEAYMKTGVSSRSIPGGACSKLHCKHPSAKKTSPLKYEARANSN